MGWKWNEGGRRATGKGRSGAPQEPGRAGVRRDHRKGGSSGEKTRTMETPARPTPMPDPRLRTEPPRHAPAADDPGTTIIEPVGSSRSPRILGVLVGVDGPLDGQLFPIFDGENTLGRAG